MKEFDDSYALTEDTGEYIAEIGTDSDFSEDVAGYDPFCSVRKLMEKGALNEAQQELESFENRGAEWYFIQACLFRKKNWFTECRKSLEHAICMEPENNTYREELKKLDEMAEQGQFASEGKGKKKQMGANEMTAFVKDCGTECASQGIAGCIWLPFELLCGRM